MYRRVLLIASCLVLSLSGCSGDSSGRFPVNGNVTLQGQPLASGTIEFEAEDGSYRTGASIVSGAYSITGSNGLEPGKYKVRVSSVESAAAAPTGPPGPESTSIEKSNKDKIPPEFNSQTNLTHESGPGKPTTFDVKIP